MAGLEPLGRTRRSSDEPIPLHRRALDDIRFIRETMERAGSFTAVSGWGIILVGVLALVTALLVAETGVSGVRWVVLWLTTALLSAAAAGIAIARKALAANVPLLHGPGRKLALSFAPPMLLGAALTAVLVHGGLLESLPALWLSAYGTAVITGGAFSVRVVPVMGCCFLALGLIGFLVPVEWGNLLMAAGFGGLHVVFGTILARRHGG